MHLDYKFDTREIQQKFKKLAQVMDGRDITRKVAGVLRQEAEKAFDQEKTPEGESWEALNEDYKERRHAAGHTGKMLQVTGDLVTSLNIDYGDSFAVIGASEPYGQYHQMGTEKMPARPFIGLGETGEKEIKQIIAKRMKEAFES